MLRTAQGTVRAALGRLTLIGILSVVGCAESTTTDDGTVHSEDSAPVYGGVIPLSAAQRRDAVPVLVTYVAHEWTTADGQKTGYCPRLVFSQDDLCFDPEIGDVPISLKNFRTVCRFAREIGNGSGSSGKEKNRKAEWELQWPLNGNAAKFRLCDEQDQRSCVSLPACKEDTAKDGSKQKCTIEVASVEPLIVIKYRVESEAYALSDGKPTGFDCPPLDPHFVIRN